VSVTSRLDFPLKYRADIDGLRAVAVVSVVVYHLGMPLHGGYVGVDIFFTISGFLIGSIILRGTSDRRFSFAGFYERRIRRLFPFPSRYQMYFFGFNPVTLRPRPTKRHYSTHGPWP